MGDNTTSQSQEITIPEWGQIKKALDKKLGSDLEGKMRMYMEHAFSNRTLVGYKSSLMHFINWSGHPDPFPTTPVIIMLYLTTYGEKLAPTTLNHRVAALSFYHSIKGYTDPTKNIHVKSLLRGIRNKRADAGWAEIQAHPFSLEDMRLMISKMDDSLRDTRDKAFLLLGLIGAFRTNELCSLDLKKFDMKYEDGFVIKLGKTKNDQGNKFKKFKMIPKIGGDLCPVQAFLNWKKASKIEKGCIFRGIDKHGNLIKTNKHLTHTTANAIVKKWSSYLNNDENTYSGNSLRSSFITIARELLIPDTIIMKQTLHQDIKTLNIYDRANPNFKLSPASTILHKLNETTI